MTASYEYEPEFLRVLRRLHAMDFDVIGCGANFGYWSILLSGRDLGSWSVVAVEPTTSTFEILREICAMNAQRFQCLQLAITSTSGPDGAHRRARRPRRCPCQ